MGQHAKRFDAVNAPKGGGLRAVVDQLKAVADTVEKQYDPNSAAVVSAMQRFEQGLALLSTAPARPDDSEPAGEEEQTGSASTGRRRRSATPKSEKGGDDGGEA